MRCGSKWLFGLLVVVVVATFALVGRTTASERGQAQVQQVSNDFHDDPGWEGVNNRVECEDPPTKKNDFGWMEGKVGGTVWNSRTPSYYATPIGPFSFEEALSASGTILLPAEHQRGAVYFGFFNHTRQEWRPWSSMAVRVGGVQPDAQGVPTADFTLDCMAASWKAGGYGVGRFPVGKPTHWSWTYEPNVTIGDDWPHPKLKQWMGTQRITEADLLTKAKADEPDMTAPKLATLLEEAQFRGLVDFYTRRGVGWGIRPDPQEYKGRIVTKLGDQPRKTYFLNKTIRVDPLVIDRFGVFNFQLPGNEIEFYLSDLAVNGKKIDLTTDPKWEGKNNRSQFVETDFHAKQDYGYSRTNHAGKATGEIGGTFWRVEPNDPLHGYYADGDIGTLTLDDPISFSGDVSFQKGGTDAGMVFGYFNARDMMVELSGKDGQAGAPLPNAMFVAIEGPTRIGYFFSAQVWPKDTRLASHSDGPVFVPDGTRHHFKLDYDPSTNQGQGTVTLTLDGKEWKHNLTREQRQSGATFDHFGLMTVRRGGKYVEVYFDDVNYTVKRAKDQTPQRHEQRVVRVPYPPTGRKY